MREPDRILLDGDVIRFRSPYENWDLPVSDVRIFGEYTNDLGPSATDYFFCFATGPGMWHEVGNGAEGCGEFLSALEAKLGVPLQFGLYNCTYEASRIVWPPSLAGEPMFKFDPIPPKGFLGTLVRFLGEPPRTEQRYSERVAAILAGDG